MLAVLSPAKTLDFDTVAKTRKRTEPRFVARADELATYMQSFSPADLSDLMGVSTKLGELNADRFDNWGRNSAPQKQAILAFKGDVYLGLEAWTFGARELTSAQRRLRILSGLYGMLRPLDMIHPYRLEMGTRLEIKRAANLYDFWGSSITDSINDDLKDHRSRVLVNLASNEYFDALDSKSIDARIVTPVFKDLHKGQYKFLSYYGKRARGLMARYLVEGNVETIKAIKEFAVDGYRYSEVESRDDAPVFLRDAPVAG
ncbi:MAG: peroxide stress protein YaaA [Pseudomonadota bacterium]|nr:peroxide stress protein YaaA [Pseudomonadota bacterium]